MKKALKISSLFLAVLFFFAWTPVQGQAPDFEGTWEITWETLTGDTRSFTVTLEKQGRIILGMAQLPMGIFTEEQSEGMEEVGLTHGDTHGHIATFHVHPTTPGSMDDQVIALYAAVGDERMEGYMTGVMPDPATAVPFVGVKRY